MNDQNGARIVKAELVQYHPLMEGWRAFSPPERVRDVKHEFEGADWGVMYPREDDDDGYTHLIYSVSGIRTRYYLAKIDIYGGWVGETTKREDHNEVQPR